MLTTTGFKQFLFSHIALAALVFGIIVSATSSIVTLSLAGAWPSVGHDHPARLAAPTDHVVTTLATSDDAAQRALRMERNDFTTWRTMLAAGDAAQRQLTMERGDFLEWARLAQPFAGQP